MAWWMCLTTTVLPLRTSVVTRDTGGSSRPLPLVSPMGRPDPVRGPSPYGSGTLTPRSFFLVSFPGQKVGTTNPCFIPSPLHPSPYNGPRGSPMVRNVRGSLFRSVRNRPSSILGRGREGGGTVSRYESTRCTERNSVSPSGPR